MATLKARQTGKGFRWHIGVRTGPEGLADVGGGYQGIRVATGGEANWGCKSLSVTAGWSKS